MQWPNAPSVPNCNIALAIYICLILLYFRSIHCAGVENMERHLDIWVGVLLLFLFLLDVTYLSVVLCTCYSHNAPLKIPHRLHFHTV